MTEKRKFEQVREIVKSHGIQIRFSKWKERYVDGWSKYRKIVILVPRHLSRLNYGEINSYLIHEFGHSLLYDRSKLKHTERHAWNAGERAVPKELLPKNFQYWKEYCLELYRSIGDASGSKTHREDLLRGNP